MIIRVARVWDVITMQSGYALHDNNFYNKPILSLGYILLGLLFIFKDELNIAG